MKPATRYGLAGIGGLGLLTVVHWLRDLALPLPPAGTFVTGILPNFAAAVAITFVLLSIWCDQHRDAEPVALRRSFAICALISGAGLFWWEFIQIRSNKLVFDWNDMVATLVGLAASLVLFTVLTPRPDATLN